MSPTTLCRFACWALVLCAGIGAAAAPKKAPRRAQVDLEQFDFRDGDVVFQHWAGHPLTAVIREVTDSQFSHCGLVVHRRGEPYVLEAVGPVRYIRLKEWLTQGENGHFVQMRPRKLSAEDIGAAINVAHKMLGQPYDIQYELDDEKIYCSELVYKAYLRGADVEIGQKEKLGDMKWRLHEAYIRALAGGELPL